VIRDMYLLHVKDPKESKYPWDYYKILDTVPGDKAFRPLKDATARWSAQPSRAGRQQTCPNSRARRRRARFAPGGFCDDRLSRLTLFIDGQWRSGEGRASEPVLNPATGSVLGQLPHASAADIYEAPASSARGFEQWRRISPVDRGRFLQRAAALIQERTEQIASLIKLELGKPIVESRVEVQTAVGIFEWNAEEGRRAYGRVIPSRSRAIRQIAVREPLGPIAAFAPWNAPAMAPARKISSALAAGCSVIIKPAEETPATALAIAAALEDAGLPAGVLNVVFGNPALISRKLLESPITRGLTFTGSTQVGKQLGALAVQTMMKMTLELGGHAPVVIFGDVDPEAAAISAVTAKFRNSGQVCTSPTRFFVHESIHNRFAVKFSELANKITVGNGFEASTKMGLLAHARRIESIERFVEDARSAVPPTRGVAASQDIANWFCIGQGCDVVDLDLVGRGDLIAFCRHVRDAVSRFCCHVSSAGITLISASLFGKRVPRKTQPLSRL
jgi:succinate-semialdehyde dehydrogenase/glutarate-semialdehyde dehydrogenase